MSAHRRRVVLAPRASAELDDILLYTKQQWGDQQRDIYLNSLLEGFNKLASYPELGVERSNMGFGARSHRIRQHIVVFHATDSELIITRIIHVRRDIDSQFSD